MNPFPFECSLAAQGQILEFIKAKPDMDAELKLCSASFELRTPDGKQVMLRAAGDHFPLEYQAKGKVSEDSFYELHGRRISITPEALKRLEGKKLALKCYSFGKSLRFFSRYRIAILKSEPAATVTK